MHPPPVLMKRNTSDRIAATAVTVPEKITLRATDHIKHLVVDNVGAFGANVNRHHNIVTAMSISVAAPSA